MVAALAAAPARAEDSERGPAKYQPYGEVVAHAGSDETGAALEAWAPLVQGDTALLFVDGRIGITEEADYYTNLGAGVRAIVGDAVALGAYGYFDVTRDDAGRNFYGATFGAEVLTPRFELRGNYYLPTSDDKYLGTDVASTGALVIDDNELLERRATMAFDLTSMRGIDGEVGVRLLGADGGSHDVRLYGGGYHYWDRLLDDVDGGYGEAEYRLHGLFGEGSFLSLAGRVSDDNLRGTEVSGQVRLRVAFGKPRGTARKLTGVEGRMTERVRRRGTILVQTRETPGTRDFGVLNDLTGAAFGQFFFADGANTVGAGDADDPTTLSDAVGRAGAGDTIVAEGGRGAIATTGITLADGASLVGGGSTTLAVRTENGGVVPFTLGTSAGTIANAGTTTDTITLGNGNLVANLSLTGGANAIAGEGITGATISNVTISGVAQSGIALDDVGTVTIAGSDITGGAGGAVAITGSGSAFLSDLSLASSGGTVLSLDGTGGELFVARFADITVAGGNGETGGVLVANATFDADPGTAAIEAVAGGDIAIGAADARVGGGGLVLDGVLGDVQFGAVDVYTDGGAGLYVRDGAGKAGTFAFGNTSGTIDALGGAAVDIDPVTVDSTFDSLTSTGSGGAGLIFDTVAGSFTVTGPTVVTDPTGDGIVILNSTADFDFGATQVTGFSGTGVDLTGAKGDAIFASLEIEGDGSAGSKGIDLSGSTNLGGFLGTTGASSIAGVGIGVDLSNAAITGTFQFGDGSDSDGNGAGSSIEADTPILATGLGTTGTYNFLDTELDGDITGLAGDAITVFFVDSTLGAGTAGDPGTIAQAEASGADIIVLVNDGLGNLDAAGSGSDNTFLLLAGQRLTGFYGQDSFTYQQGGPQSNLMVHGLAAGVTVTVDDPTGNGGATLISSASDALTLSGANLVDHVIVGDSSGFGVMVDGVSGSVGISNSDVSSLGIDGGSGIVTLVNTDLTGSTGAVLSVANGHSGALTIDAASSIADTTGTGIAFNGAAGTYGIAAPVSLTGGNVHIANSPGSFDFTGAVTITSATSTSLYLNGANGDVRFESLDIVTPTQRSIEILGATSDVTFGGGSVGDTSAAYVGVIISGQTAASTIRFTDFDILRTSSDSASLAIDTAGTVIYTGGTITNGGASAAVSVADSSGSVSIGADIEDTGSGGGVEVTGSTGGSVSFTGDLTKTGTGSAVTLTDNAGGTITFGGDITVTGGANIVIAGTNSVAFNGATSVSGATGNAVDISGANGTVSFANLDIAVTADNTVGLDLNGASFSGALTAKDFDLTSTSATGTVGVDLRNASGTVRLGDTVANGGASASISGVGTGLRIDNTSDVAFQFGDGENTVDIGSVIDVPGTAVDFTGNDGSVGSFNFFDVDWNQVSDTASYANLVSPFTVYYIDAVGDGDGSAADPGNFGAAGALSADVLILVNQNASGADTIDLNAIAQGSLGTYELQDGQGLFSFNGGEQIDLAQYGYGLRGAPSNFQFTAPTPALIDNPGAGTGAPVLTTTAGTHTITVADGAHAVLAGLVVNSPSMTAVVAGQAASLIVDHSELTGSRGLHLDMASGGSSSTLDLTVRDSIVSGTGSYGFYLRSSDTDVARVSIFDSAISGASTAFSVNTEYGGVATLSLSGLTLAGGTEGIALVAGTPGSSIRIKQLDDITVTSAGSTGFHIFSGGSSSVLFDADPDTLAIDTLVTNNLTLGTAATPLVGTALDFRDVAGAWQIGNLQSHTTAGSALLIDNSSSGADFALSTLDGDLSVAGGNTGHGALELSGVNADIRLSSLTANGGGYGIFMSGVTGVGADDNALTIGEVTIDAVDDGIYLYEVDGAVTITDGTIGATDDPLGFGTWILGGTGDVTIGADITKTGSIFIVQVWNRTTDTVTFSGALSATGGVNNGIYLNGSTGGMIEFTGPVTLATGGNSAVSLVNNTGATVEFSGGLDIDTTSGLGITASGGGTLNITGTGNTIDATAGRAFVANGMTLDVTFDHINSALASATSNISLTNVDGAFTLSAATLSSVVGSDHGNIQVLQNDSGATRSIALDLANLSITQDASSGTGASEYGVWVQTFGDDAAIVAISDSTFKTEDSGVRLDGSDNGLLTVTDFSNNTLLGDSTASNPTQFNNGAYFDGVIFDSDLVTAGLQSVSGGTFTVAENGLHGLVFRGANQGTISFDAVDIVAQDFGISANDDQSALTLQILGGDISADRVEFLPSTSMNVDITLSSLALTDQLTAQKVGGSFTVNGTTNAGLGISLTDTTADFDFGDTTINLDSGGLNAFSASGTIAGGVHFDSLSIGLSADNQVGVKLNGAILNANITAADFDLTSSSATGTVGIDLRGATGTGTVRFGDTDSAGASATIAGVGTGVILSDASSINFIFGDGENADDVGSSIAATTAIDFTNATGANGTFNFLDVTFPTGGSTDNLESAIDVYWIDAEGNGDGSKSNPGNFAGASGADVLVLANTNGATVDTIDLASGTQGAINTYTLLNGQALVSFNGGDTIDLTDYGFTAGGAPSNLLLTGITAGGTTLTNPYAGKTPILTTSAGGTFNVLNLAAGSTTWIDRVLIGPDSSPFGGIYGSAVTSLSISNSIINTAGFGIWLGLNDSAVATTGGVIVADSQITSDGTAMYFDAGDGDDLTVDLANVVASGGVGQALYARAHGTGNLTIGIDGLTASSTSGQAITMVLNSGATGDFTITRFADISVPTAASGAIAIQGLLDGSNWIAFDADPSTSAIDPVSGGDLTIGGVATPVTGAGLTLTNVAGQLDFGTINIETSGGTGLTVDNSALKAAQPALGFTLTSTGGTINSVNAPALFFDPLTLDMTLDSVSSSGAVNAIMLDEVAGALNILAGSITGSTSRGIGINASTLDFTYAGTLSNASGRAVDVTNQSAGTVTFSGAIDANVLGISVQSNTGSTIRFTGGLDIDTTNNLGFYAADGGTIEVTGTNTIDATTGALLSLSGITIGAGGITFDSLTTTGTTSGNPITLSQVGGAGSFNGGDVTIAGSTSGNGIALFDNTANIAFGAVKIDNVGSSGINIVGGSGNTITIDSVDIDGAVSAGISISNSATVVNVLGGSIGSTDDANDAAVRISGGSGDISIAADLYKTTGSYAGAIDIRNRTGGAITLSGDIDIASAIGLTGIYMTGNSGGSTTFSGANLSISTGAGTAISLSSSGGHAITFAPVAGGTGLDIVTTSASALSVTGGTFTVTGTGNSIQTGTGQIINLDGVSAGTGGINFGSLTSTGTVANTTAVRINNLDGTSFSGGTVSIAGASGSNSDGIFIGGGSAATIDFGSTTIANTGRHGINISGANNGTVTVSSVDISNVGSIGVLIEGATGAVNINGGSITGTSNTHAYVLNGTGDVSIAADITRGTGAAAMVIVDGHDAGTVTFSGDISATGSSPGIFVGNSNGGSINFTGQTIAISSGASTGVSLTNNAGGTINFNPTAGGLGLDIITTSGTGFNATGGGTVTVTGGDNTIETGTGQIIRLDGVSAGTGGINWASLTSGTTVNEAIYLNDLDGSTFGASSVTIGGTSGTTKDGIFIGGGSAAAMTFGTATIANTTGDGIKISGAGNGAITFTNALVNNTAGDGIEINGSTGIVNIGGEIGGANDPTGRALYVNGGAGTITVSANLVKTTVGNVIEVTGRSAGLVTVSGNVNALNGLANGINIHDNSGGMTQFSAGQINLTTGTNTAVNLVNNTGHAIDFGGTSGLAITTTSGTGFNATGGGTVTVQGAGIKTISTGTGTALNIVNTNIGAADATFRSISSNGGSATGIILDTTGSAGGLHVTGTGTAGSGGTIANKTGADGSFTTGNGIYLNNTADVRLAGMQLNDFQNSAIRGFAVNGFSLTDSVISGVVGDNSAPIEGAIAFGDVSGVGTAGLTGNSLIDNVDISGSIEHQIEVYNQTGTASLTIRNSNIHDNSVGSGSDGIQVEIRGTAQLLLDIDSNEFSNNKSQAIQLSALENANLQATIRNNTITRGTQGNEGIVVSNGGSATVRTLIDNNTISGFGGVSIFVGQAAGQGTSSSLLDATISNNTVISPASATNHAIVALVSSDLGQISQTRLLIDGNNVTYNSGAARAIVVDAPDSGRTPNFYATVTDNTVTATDPSAAAMISVAARNGATGHSDIRGNYVDYTGGSGAVGIIVNESSPGTNELARGTSGSNDSGVVLAANNPDSTTAVLPSAGDIPVVENNTIQLPTTPTLPTLP